MKKYYRNKVIEFHILHFSYGTEKSVNVYHLWSVGDGLSNKYRQRAIPVEEAVLPNFLFNQKPSDTNEEEPIASLDTDSTSIT